MHCTMAFYGPSTPPNTGFLAYQATEKKSFRISATGVVLELEAVHNIVKKRKLVGAGYKAAMEGSKAINLSLGYAHPVIVEIPEGIQVKCDSNTEITVSGYDKVEVGNFAAILRSKRKPEPYKGKGVRYADEVVILKEGKRK